MLVVVGPEPKKPERIEEKCMFVLQHGFCGKKPPCEEHMNLMCTTCGEPANHVCFLDSCGVPMCSQHAFCEKHTGGV